MRVQYEGDGSDVPESVVAGWDEIQRRAAANEGPRTLGDITLLRLDPDMERERAEAKAAMQPVRYALYDEVLDAALERDEVDRIPVRSTQAGTQIMDEMIEAFGRHITPQGDA